MVITIISVIVVVFHYGFSTERFNYWCRDNGGELTEIANVTCAVQYPNCWRLCDFECGTIGYYDDWAVPKCEVGK
jgi:hypothetical protein